MESMTSGKYDGINKEKSPNCDITTNEPKNKNKSENRKIPLLNDNNMIGGEKRKTISNIQQRTSTAKILFRKSLVVVNIFVDAQRAIVKYFAFVY